MKKRRAANAVMVAIIAVIVIGGVLLAGHIKGWFDRTPEAAVLTDSRGIVTLRRDGIAFSVQEDTVLRAGDSISCSSDATARVEIGGGSVVLGEGAVFAVEDPSQSSFCASLSLGEAFAEAKDAPVDIYLGGNKITLKSAVAGLSARTGAQSVSVYFGEVEGAKAGEVREWVGSDTYIHKLDISSLNDFNIAQIKAAGDGSGLFFTKADVDALVEKRQAEKEAAVRQAEEEARKAAEEAAKAEAERLAAEEAARLAAEEAARAEAEKAAAEEAAAIAQSEAEKQAAEEAARRAAEEQLAAAEEAARAEAERLAAEEAARLAAEEAARIAAEEASRMNCFLTIRCDTILDNWGDLDPAKAPYVPSNAVILGRVAAEFTDGETVFDVLKRVCNNYGIQIEYSYAPMYGNYYIEGINHLYEFDCGPESGWMYKVNGWFPNYGCSSYTLKNDDDIVWCYTCKGLGADVGGSVY